MIRPLMIDHDARSRVEAVVDYARQEEHWYFTHRGHADTTVPGDIPEHVVELNTYRCVFSYSVSGSELYRHLSISIPGPNWPNPVVIGEIGKLFGFEGWNGDVRFEDFLKTGAWRFHMDRASHSIVVVQPIDDGERPR